MNIFKNDLEQSNNCSKMSFSKYESFQKLAFPKQNLSKHVIVQTLTYLKMNLSKKNTVRKGFSPNIKLSKMSLSIT